MEGKNTVIEIIIELIKGAKNKDNRIDVDYSGRNYRLNNSRYLLNQVIRQYSLPWSHYYFSKAAIELWPKITTEKWLKTFYTAKVRCDIGTPIEITKYKGHSNTGEKHVIEPKGDWFHYREVFHDEHMITVKDIIGELLSLQDLNIENVANVLDKMYVCRMTKEEDRRITLESHRGLDLNKVINEIYRPRGIEVVPYDDLPEFLKDHEDSNSAASS